jgi:hypothetical protein
MMRFRFVSTAFANELGDYGQGIPRSQEKSAGFALDAFAISTDFH